MVERLLYSQAEAGLWRAPDRIAVRRDRVQHSSTSS
jgi:hypothetical protein